MDRNQNNQVNLWLGIVLWLIGALIIIVAFLLANGCVLSDILTFKVAATSLGDILILNMVVALIIYALFFIDILVPWINLRDSAQRRVGSLGLRWFVTGLYAFLAIATMTGCNTILSIAFATQLIIHCTLFFFLLLGMYGAFSASNKVQEIHEKSKSEQSGIAEMRKAMSRLKEKMFAVNDLPSGITARINKLDSELRYLSPSNNPEAYNLERSFIETLNEIALSDFSANEAGIENLLSKCERIYKNRLNIYSH